MKAQDAAIAISADKITGDIPSASAMVANTGTSNAALAVLLANSVRNTTKATTARIVRSTPAVSKNPLSECAKNTLVPVAFRMLLKQIPPPNRISTPQSVVFSTSFHSTALEAPSSTIAPIATKLSNLENPPIIALIGLPNIQSVTVKRKIDSVIFLLFVHSTGAWSSSNLWSSFGLVITYKIIIVIGNKIIEIGSPSAIHSVKLKPTSAAAMAFGGLPTKVAIPPIEAQ
ncbi:hypothetical protein VS_1200 [Vibrio atlanticus]|uniref:Uncharacterized protein n=1 Tax=Vibrio atlanticus (strain LGP32) TaxID=575788 RepID=B7VMS5_VIBA3|nr:hypothetical protein VS_1200 [Vibrio atlanticus]